MPAANQNVLGTYLKDRRGKLDPAALGFPLKRRRTPGLRREEVAHRANVSATWYTWLEQGRGGAPSTDVVDRIARALMLTDVEREHLFLLALGRPPEVHYQAAEGVTPRLQRVLGRRRTWKRWSMSTARRAPTSWPCGKTMTFAIRTRATNVFGTRKPE